MSENTRQGLKDLAIKLKVSVEYLLLHLEDDLSYPIT